MGGVTSDVPRPLLATERLGVDLPEVELTGGDVDLVTRGAREHADHGGNFVLYCCVESADGLGLVRLLGHDPTSA